MTHPSLIKKIALAVFITSNYLAQTAHADDAIVIESNIPYISDNVGNETIRNECRWTQTLSENIVSFSKGAIIATDQNLEERPGKKLIIKITSVHSIGGRGFTGPKWARIRGDLFESGKLLSSFDFYSKTNAGRMTACDTLDYIAHSLGRKVAKWVNSKKYETNTQTIDPVDAE